MENIAGRFHYYSDIGPIDAANAYILDVGGIKEKEDLIMYYYRLLKLPIHSPNWDAFDEGLADCTWINSDKVSLVHKNLPDLSLKDMHVYLDILAQTTDLHSGGPRQDRRLPQKKVDFKVYFPLSLRNEIVDILNLTV